MASIAIDQIDIRPDARAIDAGTVAGLVDSIGAVGLIHPIRVRPAGERWQVIAGAHRLQACRDLGLVEIDAVVVADDDLHAELAMIDENLCRSELSPSDRARQTARRKVIYEELHPETRHGGNRRSDQVDNLSVRSFAAETAALAGVDERSVRRDAERGEKVTEEAMGLIRGTHLDTGSYLDKLKRMTPNDQVTAIQRDLLAREIREAQSAVQNRRSASIEADVKARAAREVAEIIAEFVPGEAWDGLKANLYASGAKAVADALTNITGQSIMDRNFA